MIAIVDAGPLYAAADIADSDHAAALTVLGRPDLQLVIPALAPAEAIYLVERRFGSRVAANFLRGLASFDVEAPAPEDRPRIAEHVEQYADFPLGSTDASVVALAARLETDVVITLDRRHFSAFGRDTAKLCACLPD